MSMNSSPYVVLITGAASGIGQCFLQYYHKQPNTYILACDVQNISVPELSQHESRKVQKHNVNFALEASITEFVHSIRRPGPEPNGGSKGISKIDLVIHSAGIRGLVPAVESNKPEDVAAAETLQVMDGETMDRTYRINTIGTFILLQQLAVANLFHEHDLDATQTTKVVIMTSRMGSISANTVGSGFAYRASKAALNAIIRSMSIDLPHVIFALVHPGRVETGLTKCREDGAIEVEESVRDMLVLIKSMKPEDGCRYQDRFGAVIGW